MSQRAIRLGLPACLLAAALPPGARIARAGGPAPVPPAATRGNLIIVGGGDTPDDVQARFVALAGGPGRARIAVLPMASDAFDEEVGEVTADFERLGARVALMNLGHLDADRPDIAARFEDFGGFWFTGGDQSRLAKALMGTLALETITRRYREGAVIGGTSAGASVMSRTMLTGRWRRTARSEDAEILNIARGEKEVARGFGFLEGAIIDQHFMHRPRYNRLISAVLDHPRLIGAGIDEDTALLVRPDGAWEVLGRHYVKIFDARRARIDEDDGPMARAGNVRMHVLPAGSVFDPRTRRIWQVRRAVDGQ